MKFDIRSLICLAVALLPAPAMATPAPANENQLTCGNIGWHNGWTRIDHAGTDNLFANEVLLADSKTPDAPIASKVMIDLFDVKPKYNGAKWHYRKTSYGVKVMACAKGATKPASFGTILPTATPGLYSNNNIK